MNLLPLFLEQLASKLGGPHRLYVVFRKDEDQLLSKLVGIFDNPDETVKKIVLFTLQGKDPISDLLRNYYQRPVGKKFNIANDEFSVGLESQKVLKIIKKTVNNFELTVRIIQTESDLNLALQIYTQ